jgi:cell division protein FtsW
MLVFQAIINMAVAVNLLPVTGQTLPMVSMGGSSMLFTGISVGILLSVSRDLEKQPESIPLDNEEIQYHKNNENEDNIDDEQEE